jgi:hypothetical protein
MSKITPKNLQYDSTLPPFLARLQQNNSNSDGRHEYIVSRPKKARNPEDEAEDEPVYFNEETGETLTKSQWEEREGDSKTKDSRGIEEDEAGLREAAKVEGENKDKERLAAIGGSKKRKVGKVIGTEDEGEEKPARLSGEKKAVKLDGKKIEKGKPTKKAKKVKLSFDD